MQNSYLPCFLPIYIAEFCIGNFIILGFPFDGAEVPALTLGGRPLPLPRPLPGLAPLALAPLPDPPRPPPLPPDGAGILVPSGIRLSTKFEM